MLRCFRLSGAFSHADLIAATDFQKKTEEIVQKLVSGHRERILTDMARRSTLGGLFLPFGADFFRSISVSAELEAAYC